MATCIRLSGFMPFIFVGLYAAEGYAGEGRCAAGGGQACTASLDEESPPMGVALIQRAQGTLGRASESLRTLLQDGVGSASVEVENRLDKAFQAGGLPGHKLDMLFAKIAKTRDRIKDLRSERSSASGSRRAEIQKKLDNSESLLNHEKSRVTYLVEIVDRISKLEVEVSKVDKIQAMGPHAKVEVSQLKTLVEDVHNFLDMINDIEVDTSEDDAPVSELPAATATESDTTPAPAPALPGLPEDLKKKLQPHFKGKIPVTVWVTHPMDKVKDKEKEAVTEPPTTALSEDATTPLPEAAAEATTAAPSLAAEAEKGAEAAAEATTAAPAPAAETTKAPEIVPSSVLPSPEDTVSKELASASALAKANESAIEEDLKKEPADPDFKNVSHKESAIEASDTEVKGIGGKAKEEKKKDLASGKELEHEGDEEDSEAREKEKAGSHADKKHKLLLVQVQRQA